ncbi:MAG: LamG domain-containing protein, partial [Spirochaetales bacterium]|nr:LamG domain-containing protein [Spirochaetales bacterium]
DWYFGTDPFTIDFWLRFNNLPSTSCGIFNQYDDADNTVRLSYDKTNTRVRLVVISGGSVVVSLESYKELFVDEWYHIELVRNGTSWVIYIGGVDRMVFGGTGAGAWPDLSGDIEIGRDTQDGIAYRYFDGWIDEVRFSKGIARNTEDFAPHSRPYMIARNNWLVGSIRPIQGIKYYIEGPNTVDSTVTGSYWNGKSWQTLDITDGTKPGTVSLAQTGFMTWSDTVGQARSVYLNGYFVNWYQFELSAGDATISHVTIDAEMQPILAHWDGVYRAALRFMERKAAYTDKTLNVLSEDYDADTPSTFFAVGGLSAFSDPDQCVEIGFAEKITAVWWTIAAKNTTAATTVAVDYWDGDAFLPIGTVVDGTEVGGISLAKSGAMSWFNSSIENETQKQVFSGLELYYYRFRWDTDLTAGARADYIGGITACETLHHYSFPIFAQGRVFLCDDITQARNSALVSGKYTPHVFIGSDSTRVYFGNDEPIKCGTELFSLFGSSLYSLVLMFKDTETWVMAGQEIGQWKNSIFQLSSSIGCPAPLTMKTVNLAANPGSGVNRSLVIWQGANGIYMSDGRSPIPIHEDINEYFDRSDTRCIKESKVGDSTGWIDPTRNEYHWKFASGATATDLNKELVYDIKRNKWFEIDRGTGKSLQCGVLVTDTDGNSYNYGFIDSGYMERLENGTDFDGADIDHTFQFGDMAFEGLAFATQIDRIKLLTVAKTVTDQDIICTHYGNTSIAGTAITMSPSNAGYRLAKPDFPEKLDGDPFHSLKFATSTDDEVIGFEPLAVVVTHHAIRED